MSSGGSSVGIVQGLKFIHPGALVIGISNRTSPTVMNELRGQQRTIV